MKGVTGFQVKCAALFFMVFDHVGRAMQGGALSFAFRLAGRVSFPIFAFFIAEGMKKTSDRRKYLTRLGLFAFLSEMPYDLFMHGQFFYWEDQNIFFTLLIGACACWAYMAVSNGVSVLSFGEDSVMLGRFVGFMSGFFVCLAAELFMADYGFIGCLAVLVCFVFNDRLFQVIALSTVMFLLYGTDAWFLGVLPALGLLYIYNGERGRAMKWLFYFAYPLHLFVLYAVFSFIP